MDQYENLIILKDGQICTTLIQQKDTTRYQSAFYDQYTFAYSATVKRIPKDDLQKKQLSEIWFRNSALFKKILDRINDDYFTCF